MASASRAHQAACTPRETGAIVPRLRAFVIPANLEPTCSTRNAGASYRARIGHYFPYTASRAKAVLDASAAAASLVCNEVSRASTHCPPRCTLASRCVPRTGNRRLTRNPIGRTLFPTLPTLGAEPSPFLLREPSTLMTNEKGPRLPLDLFDRPSKNPLKNDFEI